MTNEKIEQGIEIQKLIEVTSKALNEIERMIDDVRSKTDNKLYKEDEHYWLSISQHKDGSGINVDLHRYYGNTRLLAVIRNELRKQLDEFELDFERL